MLAENSCDAGSQGACQFRYFPGEIIPDGQGGLLAAWTRDVTEQEAHLTRLISSGNTEYTLPFQGWNSPGDSLVLGENGTAFAGDTGKFVRFNLATGSINWSWQANNTTAEMIAASSGNGLVVRDGNQVARLDPSGAATYDAWTGTDIQYAYCNMWLSRGSNRGVLAEAVNLPWTIWAKLRGFWRSGGPTPKVELRVFKVAGCGPSDANVTTFTQGAIEYWQEQGILLDWKGGTIHSVGETNLCEINDTNLGSVRGVLAAYLNPSNGDDINKGGNLLFTELLPPDVNGYTAQVAPGRFGNISLFVKDPGNVLVPSWKIVSHEIGHEFQLFHVTAPINLMCGSDDPFIQLGCETSASTYLSGTQIDKASENAKSLGR